MLRYKNGLTADCSKFPKVGTSLCIPATCDIYTLQANETCYNISQAHNASFTVTQLISWNPDINRDCSNLEAIVGTHLCVRYAQPYITMCYADAHNLKRSRGYRVRRNHDRYNHRRTHVSRSSVLAYISLYLLSGPSRPAPSNVVNGTNLRCAKYYEVVPRDTCSSVTVMMAISLSDFYFLVLYTSSYRLSLLFKLVTCYRIPRLTTPTVPICWLDTPSLGRPL